MSPAPSSAGTSAIRAWPSATSDRLNCSSPTRRGRYHLSGSHRCRTSHYSAGSLVSMFFRTRIAVFALAATLIVALPVTRAAADTVSDKAREAGELTAAVDAAKQRAGELGADYLRAMERSAEADAAAAAARTRLANAKARAAAARARVSAVAVDLYISGASDTGTMLRQAFGTDLDGATSVYIDTAGEAQDALVQEAAGA